MSVTEADRAASPVNLPAAIMFSLTTLGVLTVLPWYFWNFDLHASAWAWFAMLMVANGMAITAGYHRLWAHRTYEAHWSLQILYMLVGAMALQNSALTWCSQHRIHHKHVDDVDHDPYSIKRGFWYAHIGWMLRDYPSGKLDFANAKDLEANPIVMFQHRHYLGIALFMNIAFPLLLGFAYGDPWGFLMLGGLLRLVASHHVTFCINSLAHYWGRRPYTSENSARDNDLIALFTYGEGYHNFHHLFQYDYRNGVRWWQIDPTKWWIAACSWFGLTRSLKRVPEFKIQRAMLQRQFEKAQEKLAALRDRASPTRLSLLQEQLEKEMEAFSATVNAWSQLQAEKFEAARKELADHWEHSDMRRRLQALEDALREQRERISSLHLQAA
ncbi:MAG TPA: fatty acid desaturase [Nevskiaceae bacterium]|nr:fatty acid desaturase [Nevskiaceae bacterium]